MVVDVVGGHQTHTHSGGQIGQGIIALDVQWVPVVPEFDHHPITAEPVHQVVQRPTGRRRTVGLQRCGNSSLAATSEHCPVGIGTGQLGQTVRRESGSTLPSGQLGLGNGRSQPGVADRIGGQDDKMGGRRVRCPGPSRPRGRPVGGGPVGGGHVEGKLTTEDGGQAVGPGGLGEPHHPIEAVVVGERQGT